MKRRLTKLLCAALALMILGAAALADVRTTGNVWMRTGPGLGYDTITSFSTGTSLTYLGETSVDERGVAWYKVSNGWATGWVSSRYSQLVGENPALTAAPTAAPTAEPTAVPAPTPAGDAFFFTQPSRTEVSIYYRQNLDAAAEALGLENYMEDPNSEAPRRFYGEALTIGGEEELSMVVLTGAKYALFGVAVGDSADGVQEKLTAAGLAYQGEFNAGLQFFHRDQSGEGYATEEGFDSVVYVTIQNGAVAQMEWYSFTG